MSVPDLSDTATTGDQAAKLRLLWSFARPHARTLVFGLLLALAGSSVGLASPLVIKWVLDSLNAGLSMRDPVAVLLALFVVGAAMSWFQWTLLGATGERVVLDARRSMVERFLGATVPALSARPVGELVTRVTADSLLLRESATSSVIGIINGVVMLIGTLVLMGVLDLALLGLTAAAVIVVVALFATLMPPIAVAQAKAQEHVGRLGGTLEASLRAIRTVKASRAEARLGDQILEDADLAARFGMRVVRSQAFAWIIAWSGVQLAIIAVLGIGAWRVDAGKLEISSLIAFLLYTFGLMGPIMELTQNVTAFQAGIAAASRIQEINTLDREEDLAAVDHIAPGDLSAAEPVIELANVTFAYGSDRPPAVDQISLSIQDRRHTAIVGPSGAGKTTLFSLLLRFIEPDSGKMIIGGRPYAALTHAQVRAHFAYVEQDTPVLPGTIRDNLRFTHPDATDAELSEALRAVRLDTFVASLPEGLDTWLSSTSVSGGQRQRIALARAIVRPPAVLLLDEATAQVDALTELAIGECIRRQRERGAVVTIAHRLSTVIDADTIVVMHEGRIRAQGRHEQLLTADQLYGDLVAALHIAGHETEAPVELAPSLA